MGGKQGPDTDGPGTLSSRSISNVDIYFGIKLREICDGNVTAASLVLELLLCFFFFFFSHKDGRVSKYDKKYDDLVYSMSIFSGMECRSVCTWVYFYTYDITRLHRYTESIRVHLILHRIAQTRKSH